MTSSRWPWKWDPKRRLAAAGAMICAGLIVQALTLLWAHPLSFIAFLALGACLVAAGILLYLSSWLR